MSTTRLSRRRAPATPTVRRLGRGDPIEARPAVTGAVREPLAPPWASTTRRAGGRPRWLPRMTRGRALAMLAVSLVVLMGGMFAVSAAPAGAAADRRTVPAGLAVADLPPARADHHAAADRRAATDPDRPDYPGD